MHRLEPQMNSVSEFSSHGANISVPITSGSLLRRTQTFMAPDLVVSAGLSWVWIFQPIVICPSSVRLHLGRVSACTCVSENSICSFALLLCSSHCRNPVCVQLFRMMNNMAITLVLCHVYDTSCFRNTMGSASCCSLHPPEAQKAWL